uniref:Uncharacterized protein n=1 Tax=Echinococcus canadensis TaxID=519352 RepID=A0A915EWH6_9CEST
MHASPTGLRGEHALTVQTILNNFDSLIFCTFPLGFCVASTIRIGQFLKANKAEGPVSTSCVAIFTIVVLPIVGFVIIICTRFYIPRIFTSDP